MAALGRFWNGRGEPSEIYVVDICGRVTSEMCVLFRGGVITILTPFQPASLQWVDVLIYCKKSQSSACSATP